ncbi:hypothetical protein [Cerasicoccus fimbriatus]|uniref:hypothetical protein n=1 Tax=Cerasicoccus fimbriatus TaxID=3014554 RepID=UPI0022B5B6F5|nr:hypothetical protein [Cerasicoccus sp. TK19100]
MSNAPKTAQFPSMPSTPHLPPHERWDKRPLKFRDHERWDDFLTFAIRSLIDAPAGALIPLVAGAERIAPSDSSQLLVNQIGQAWDNILMAVYDVHSDFGLSSDTDFLRGAENTPVRHFGEWLHELCLTLCDKRDYITRNDELRHSVKQFTDALERFQINEMSLFSQIQIPEQSQAKAS